MNTRADRFERLADAARPDLAERREHKLPFPGHDVAALRDALRAHCRPLAYAGPVSRVHSVYFDDLELGACRANLAGVGVRHKTRLRWYDAELPGDRFQLEIKWRRHQATGKHRFAFTGGDLLREAPLAGLPRELGASLPAPCAAVLENAAQPVALVEYRREHFALGRARLTLDYDLRVYPLLGTARLCRRFGERVHGAALVECKTPLAGEPLLAPLLRALGARPARFSKYVTACQRLGYVPAG